jgi:AcrR family transcriptional regulator/DNA-binding XRE family transcriptional regulator
MRAARVSRGLGLRELAQQVGMSPSSLSEFEHGKSRPGAERLAALSAALGVPIEEAKPAPVVPEFRHWREYVELDLDPVSRAGLELFVERGFHGSTVRMIAERCGMTVAGVYHHVASKHELLLGLMRRGMAEMAARCAAADAEGESPRERLTSLVESLVIFHIFRLPLAYIVTNEIRGLDAPARAEMVTERLRVLQYFADAVTDCRGDSSAATAPDWVTARAIVTMCAAVPDFYDDAGRPDPGGLAEEYVALAVAMVYP